MVGVIPRRLQYLAENTMVSTDWTYILCSDYLVNSLLALLNMFVYDRMYFSQ